MVKQKAVKEQAGTADSNRQDGSQMFESLFGFKISDLSSLESLLRLLCRPTDPASLGVMRMIFGKLYFVFCFMAN